jgi:cyanophycinase
LGLASLEPPAVSAAEPISGSLVIVGGGMLPDTVASRFLELAGGQSANILVIPTASIRAEQPELLTTYNFFKSQGVAVDLLHTRDRQRANERAFAERIRQASGVWLTGGDQNRLIDTYHGTVVEKELHQLLKNGKVIGGTSAGAAVMSSLAILGGEQMATVGHGFGFLPGMVIDQHFHNRNRIGRLKGVLAKNPRLLGVGIDEQTAIVVRGRTLTVLGNANVHVCWKPFKPQEDGVRVLKPGDQLDYLDLYDDLLGEDAPQPQSK